MLAFIFGTDETGWVATAAFLVMLGIVALGFFLPRDARKQEYQRAKAQGYVDPELRKLRNDVVVLDTALTAAEEALAEIHLLLHDRKPLTLYRVQQLHEDVHAKLRVNGIEWEEAAL